LTVPPHRAPRRSATPLLVIGALAVLVVLALLLALALRLRGRGEEGPPRDVLGSALPEGWLPGEGRGAGRVPPPPPRDPTPPPGAAPAAPAPEVPLDGAGRRRPDRPFPEATPPGLPPPPYEATPPEPPPEEEPAVVFEPPRLIAMPSPSYPRVGRRMRMEATVVVRVRVSTRGRVIDAEPVGDTVGYGFEDAALRAARKARFEPARRNGEPVVADTRIAVRFEL
jgi:protein TonB